MELTSGFLLTATWIPGIAGASVSPRWALLAIGVPVILLCLRESFRVTSAVWPGVALLGYAALSLLWAIAPLDGATALYQLLLLAGISAIGARLVSLDRFFVGAACGLSISSALNLLYWIGYPTDDLNFTGTIEQQYGGTFFNPNVLAETAALVTVGCFVCRRYWAAALAGSSMIFAHSRGALLGIVAAALLWTWKRSPLSTVVLSVFLCVGAVAFQNRVNLSSYTDRIHIYQDTAKGLTLFGKGLGSFRYEFPRYGLPLNTRPHHAHNDFLEFWHDLGLVGLLLYLVLLGNALLQRGFEPERLVLCAFLVEGLAQFPLWTPASAAIAALCLGQLFSSGWVTRSLLYGPNTIIGLRPRPTCAMTRSQQSITLFMPHGSPQDNFIPATVPPRWLVWICGYLMTWLFRLSNRRSTRTPIR